MNKKLKIYSVLLAVVLVGMVISLTFHYDRYSSCNLKDDVLTLDSLTEEFAEIDENIVTRVDTIVGGTDTLTSTSWNVFFKPTFELTVPVRPSRAAKDKYLYSRLKGQNCMVEMQQVKLKVPFEKVSPDFILANVLFACSTLPLFIWLLVIILKVIRSVYKGEIFVTQIAKRVETAGKLLVAIWVVENVVTYFQIKMLQGDLEMAYYNIYWQPTSVNYIIYGLVLMILSQIILKGKDLKDEQELTI